MYISMGKRPCLKSMTGPRVFHGQSFWTCGISQSSLHTHQPRLICIFGIEIPQISRLEKTPFECVEYAATSPSVGVRQGILMLARALCAIGSLAGSEVRSSLCVRPAGGAASPRETERHGLIKNAAKQSRVPPSRRQQTRSQSENWTL